MRLELMRGGGLVGMAWFAMTLLGLPGCTAQTTGVGPTFVRHCGDNQGDATCRAAQPAFPFCNVCQASTVRQGCASTRPASASCEPMPSMTGTFTAGDSETGASTSTGSSSGSTTAEPATEASTGTSTGGAGCEVQGAFDPACAELDAAMPYCLDAECVGCELAGDDFCVATDPLTPACEGGVCVACTEVNTSVCIDDAPVCSADGSCAPCASHSDCPGAACHLDAGDPQAGSCFALDQVRWVDNAVACPGEGTQVAPACSLAAELSAVGPGDSAVVHVVGGGDPYAESYAIDGPGSLAILGQALPTFSGSGLAPSLMVAGGFVYLEGLAVSGNTGTHGLQCNAATLWMQDSLVGGNVGYGLFSSGPCELNIEATSVFTNLAGGIRALGGSLRLDNSAVAHNGSPTENPGLELQFVAIDILYSTIAGNAAVGPDSMQCLDVIGTVRNSIVVGANGDSVALDCFGVDFSTTAVDRSNFAGAGTFVDQPYNENWFNVPLAGDFGLGAPPLTPFGDVALWVEGDPMLDADGTMRPIDGVFGYAGMDEP